MDKEQHLESIEGRHAKALSSMWKSQYTNFINAIQLAGLPRNARVLSLSVGNGFWDYLVFKHLPGGCSITATDIVDNPVAPEDVGKLRFLGDWSFVKVGETLPFEDASFDLVFHMDVIEHTRTPLAFLVEQYRVLRPGGYLLVGTPNLFRPGNVIKLLLGRLSFPAVIGFNEEIGEYVHEQEFHLRQLQLLVGEAGFDVVDERYALFGLSFLKVVFSHYPKGHLGRQLCQFFQLLCRKP